MGLDITIEFLTLVLALFGLLVHTRRDEAAGPSWSDLNKWGRLILALLVIGAGLKILKDRWDSQARSEETLARAQAIDRLQESNKSLLDKNQLLIKVMSVSGGYS